MQAGDPSPASGAEGIRHLLAIASIVAFTSTLVFVGPGDAFLIASALSMIAALGYSVVAERHLRATVAAVARVARHLHAEDRPRDALDGALRELLSIFEARALRSIGGTLTIESVPGHGARLQVSLPGRARG
jgi:hypothetical protein